MKFFSLPLFQILSSRRTIFVIGFLGVVFFLSLSGAGFLVRGASSLAVDEGVPKVHAVVLTHSGFSPEKIEIHEGDTVIFSSEKKTEFWPASDPHPTHTGYSSFDPERPLLSEETWSIRFDTLGVWRYHDHLSPSLRGVVTVLPPEGEGVSSSCTEETAASSTYCFEERIRLAIEEGGIEAGWALFQKLYEEGITPRTCHWTAHFIGEEAFSLFKAGKEISFSKATSYCGFGFYHGFIENLLRENPDPENALRLCDRIQEQLGSMGLQNCYHGIGHGYTEDPPDPKTVGNFEAMIKPGVKMCEFLFGDVFTNLNLCLTGVFTVPAGFAAEGEYGLSLPPEDPFFYCHNQPYRYLKACYGEFAPKLDRILGWDLHGLPLYIDDIRDDKLKSLVVWVVPAVMMAHDIFQNDHSEYVTSCRSGFGSPLREICWGGAILGFFQHGEPEKQYEKVLAFCAADAWEEHERGFCYGESFRRFRQEYAPEKTANLCTLIPEQYRFLCFDEKKRHHTPYNDPSFESA